MKMWIVFLLLLLVPMIRADDSEFVGACNGDSQLMGLCLGSPENGTLFTDDTTPPYFTTIPAGSNLTYLEGLSVDFDATDETSFDSYTVNDTNFAIDTDGLLTNNTVLGVANYYINVTINDSSNNLNSTIYNVNITQKSDYLSITGTTPRTLGYPSDFEGLGCPSQLTCVFARDGNTSITNPDTTILAAGLYNYTYNSTGNTNYTSDLVSETLLVVASGNGTTVSTPVCKYKKYGYYNIKLPWFREEDCL